MDNQVLSLFLSFLQIGAGSIGGGYAVIPAISRQAVSLHMWITAQEFTDIITISQMTPGPLAVNTSTFVGLRIAGIPGALAATVGCVLPGILLSLVLHSLFRRFQKSPVAAALLKILRAVSAGLIAAAAATILGLIFINKTGYDAGAAAIILAASLWVLRKFRADPMLIMTGSAAMGIAALLIRPLFY